MFNGSSASHAVGDKQAIVMVVDDDDGFRRSLTTILSRRYEVISCASGEEAVQQFHPEVDTVLLDIRMPGLDGLDTCRRLQEANPFTPIIFVTGHSGDYEPLNILQTYHPFSYIVKGSPSHLLIENLERAIQFVNLHRQNQRLVKELQKALDDLSAAQEELVKTERLAAIGLMANKVVHDIKNLMTVMVGSAHLLARDDLNNEQRHEFSQSIVEEIRRFAGMAQEILDYSRGEITLQRSDVNVRQFLESLCDLLKRQFEEQGVTIVCDAEDAGALNVDEDRLRRAFLNIGVNACEAMTLPHAHLAQKEIRLSARADDDCVEFTFADTGPGIPEEIRDNIFAPFVTYGKGGGTGLGLAIAQHIVDLHSGTIEMRSEAGMGTTFQVRLPRSA
jgi:signal transduction histidine kinase